MFSEKKLYEVSPPVKSSRKKIKIMKIRSTVTPLEEVPIEEVNYKLQRLVLDNQNNISITPIETVEIISKYSLIPEINTIEKLSIAKPLKVKSLKNTFKKIEIIEPHAEILTENGISYKNDQQILFPKSGCNCSKLLWVTIFAATILILQSLFIYFFCKLD